MNEYSLSYNVCKNVCNGFKMVVNHRLAVLFPEGNSDLFVLLESLAALPEEGHQTIVNVRTGKNYVLREGQWQSYRAVKLSEEEKKTILLCHQGLDSKQIASVLYKSTDRIKDYRKSIFKKLGVKNMTQAVVYARLHKLL